MTLHILLCFDTLIPTHRYTYAINDITTYNTNTPVCTHCA